MQQAWDVVLLIPAWSELGDWRDRTHLYVHQRPLAVDEGSRVWLCKDRRLVHSYRIDGFVELSEALPGDEAHEQEHGWAIAVSDGKRANRDIDDIPDPHGVVRRWMQGFRYLTPGAREFVKAPRRPRAVRASSASASPPLPQPTVPPVDTEAPPVASGPKPTWAGRLAQRLGKH